jgi:cathepsin X
MGGKCVEIDSFPNATVAEYGGYSLFESDKVHKIKAEIFARGPVAAGVNAEPIVGYKGGIVKDRNLLHKLINHVVSIVGWGKEGETEYWIVRNSWGKHLIPIFVALVINDKSRYGVNMCKFLTVHIFS